MSGSSSANKRSARKSAAAAAAAKKRPNGTLEDGLRALNAKLISRLRASEEAAQAAATARGAAQQSLAAAQRARKSAEARLSQLHADKAQLEQRLRGSEHSAAAQAAVHDELLRALRQQLDDQAADKQRLQMRVLTLEKLALSATPVAAAAAAAAADAAAAAAGGEHSVPLSSVSTHVSCARSCSSSSDAREPGGGGAQEARDDQAVSEQLHSGAVVADSAAWQPQQRNALRSVVQRVWSLLTAVWHRIVAALHGLKGGVVAGGGEETLPLLRA